MHRINALIILIGLARTSMAQTGARPTLVQVIAPRELHASLADPHVHVIDVNDPDNYAMAHVPGATHLEYDAVNVTTLPADTSAMLVFYCWSPECPAASMAAASAAKLGFKRVFCMREGITGWQDAGFATEP